MDVLPLASLLDVVFPQLRIFLDIADAFARKFVRGYQLWKWYGQAGVPLFIFGNRTTWRIQAQILGELNDDDALAFKTSVYNECTMIAVAAAIVAQIAITGLSLNFLSQTHWVARACFVLSLTFALMAVYYSTTQQRTLGRLLKAKGVRLWIRGGNRHSPTGRIIPTLDDLVKKLPFLEIRDTPRQDSALFRVTALIQNSWLLSRLLSGVYAFLYATRYDFDFVSSDPDDYTPDLSSIEDIKSDIIYHCFTPSAASVLTISAPQMMLTASLGMLLTGLAIYFGFLWTRNLDTNAGFHDSRNVFITYAAGLAIAVVVYNLSLFFQDDDQRSERQIVEAYLDDYLSNHPNAVTRWGLDHPQLENGIQLADREREGREHGNEAQNT